MIRLTRPAAPSKLTPAFVNAGTLQYMADGSSVWNVTEIKETLSAMSHGKCAYCELALGKGATYLEVEHFYAKQHHPGRVLDWDNLLPACRRCNGCKGAWDVNLPGQMIVDPVLAAPQQHIRLNDAYMPVGRTPDGENTIIEIELNNIDRLGVLRYRIGEKFKQKLEEILEAYTTLPSTASPRQRRVVIRKVSAALEKCHADQPFSAVVATVLQRSDIYRSLKIAMIAAGEWNANLQASDQIAQNASLA